MGTNANEEVQQLVGRAEHAISTLQPELACKFYERALEKAPEQTTILDALGELLVGLGKPDRAKKLFEKSTTLEPEKSASKWLYLGQLQEGWEAKQSFSKGVELLLAELKVKEESKQSSDTADAQMKGDDEEDEEEDEGDHETAVIKDQICSTYCSIAELYLTDLCFEENAEQECQEALNEAIKYDQGSAEVTQSLASLRLSQVKGEEAAALMMETYRRLRHYDEESMPGLAFRVNTAKLLLECGAHEKKCAKMAVDVLEMCKCEDDECVELWYLLGVAYFTKSKPDLTMARAHLEYARGLLMRIKEAVGEELSMQDQLKLIDEQLEMVKDAQVNGTVSCGGEEEEEYSDDGDSDEEDEEGDDMDEGEEKEEESGGTA